MAAYLNMVVLAGVLGNDATFHPQANGHTAVMLRIATLDAWRDGNGQRQERTEWHNVVYWSRTANQTAFLQRALLKGWTVTVTGSSRTREYTDQQTNTRRFVTEVHADNVQVGGPVQNLNQATNTSREAMPPPASSARVLTHPAARNTAAVPHGIPAGYVPQVVDSPASIPMDAEPLYADYGPPLQHF